MWEYLQNIINIYCAFVGMGGTRWRSWLRHRSTSRKVAGSIPDSVIVIFHWQNPSGHTMALGLTQPLTQMSTRNISCGGKGGRCVGLTTYHIHVPIVLISGRASTSWNPQGLSRPVMGLLYLLFVGMNNKNVLFFVLPYILGCWIRHVL